MFRYYYKDKAISEKDCDEFLENYKDVEFSSGLVGKENKNVEEDRKAKIHWLEGTNILVNAAREVITGDYANIEKYILGT